FVVGMYGGKPLGPVKFAIDGVNYTEETFVKKLAQLPVNGYEIVYPFPVQKTKTGSPIRVEIKVLDKKEWSLQGLMQNILPPLKKESGDGC
ncbi:MAG: hypothetical protein JNM68_12590, partial [Dinghuibacter sp.]|nr:hypothetical protein [Dinghuibacter sp.]